MKKIPARLKKNFYGMKKRQIFVPSYKTIFPLHPEENRKILEFYFAVEKKVLSS